MITGMGDFKPQIQFTPPPDDVTKQRMMEIRFDAKVSMYDFGSKTTPRGKPYPPQWFKLDFRLTLEGIEYSDEREIGRAIKNAYVKLKDSIRQYENS